MRIVSRSLIEGALRRLDDVTRRRQVGIAAAQGDDVVARRGDLEHARAGALFRDPDSASQSLPERRARLLLDNHVQSLLVVAYHSYCQLTWPLVTNCSPSTK